MTRSGFARETRADRGCAQPTSLRIPASISCTARFSFATPSSWRAGQPFWTMRSSFATTHRSDHRHRNAAAGISRPCQKVFGRLSSQWTISHSLRTSSLSAPKSLFSSGAAQGAIILTGFGKCFWWAKPVGKMVGKNSQAPDKTGQQE